MFLAQVIWVCSKFDPGGSFFSLFSFFLRFLRCWVRDGLTHYEYLFLFIWIGESLPHPSPSSSKQAVEAKKLLTPNACRRGIAVYVGRDVSKLKNKGGKWKYVFSSLYSIHTTLTCISYSHRYMSEQEMLATAAKFSPYRYVMVVLFPKYDTCSLDKKLTLPSWGLLF
jgi:hypothetical protein